MDMMYIHVSGSSEWTILTNSRASLATISGVLGDPAARSLSPSYATTARGRWASTILFAYWFRSVYWEPPNPRWMTASGFISATSVSQSRMLEAPVKTMPPGFGGFALSSSSNLRIEDSQFWDCATAVDTKQSWRPKTRRNTKMRLTPTRSLRIG